MGFESLQERLRGARLKDQVHDMRRYQLFALVGDCSQIFEDDLMHVTAELARRFGDRTTERDRLMFTVFACSSDPKQRTFGLDMLTNFIPDDEQEKYLTAIYFFAESSDKERDEGKNVARLSVGTRLLVSSPNDPGSDQLFTDLAHKHEEFLERFSQIKSSTT